MPHSHLRSNVSIVYLLDPGDPDPDDAMAGKLIFADPRIPYCCPHEPGRVTGLLVPDLREGTMIIFASDYLHSVNPYRGARPRMSMSWNVTLSRVPGQAGEGWQT
jgi:predicted 2-oxoglutarate/Fe(II)-dependent dioxygenase YbiX